MGHCNILISRLVLPCTSQGSTIVKCNFTGQNLCYKMVSSRYSTSFPLKLTVIVVFSCDQAALWMVQSVRPSVRPSVCPSVCLSHLFDYVPIILSSWNFQELLPVTKVTSMQKVKVRGQRSRSQRSRPKFSFPDCNSSLNSHMMMKWYI